MKSQWSGKKVAFIGDSITDKCHVGTDKNYWQFLEETLEIVPLVYGQNGWQSDGIREQAEWLLREHGQDVDAIFVLMGTNDFNNSIAMGEWWDCTMQVVRHSYGTTPRCRRTPQMRSDTFRGRLNMGLSFLKETFPHAQIVLLTPIHRGYAIFSEDNVQPDESFANGMGLFIQDYANAVKEAGPIWSVPVIDLFALSGLLPAMPAYSEFFHDAQTDCLHPNAQGHKRMALTMMYQMLALPASFR